MTSERLERVREERKIVERQLAIKRSRDELLTFAKLMRPHPADPGDSSRSRYEVALLHEAIGAALQDIEARKFNRLIITVPPRHGKSTLTSEIFPPWFVGRDPTRSIIVGSFNESKATDYGRAVRGYMQSRAYAQVFPDCKLMKGSQAVDMQNTQAGGQLTFAGIGGTVTGRGGDLIVLDDPLKGSEEAASQTLRDRLWTWLNRDLMTRFMTDEGIILLIQTRWHGDDPVGRLTDPTNPHYNEDESKLWKIINIPALAEEDDPLGRQVGEALWPKRFGVPFLLSAQRRDPVGFSALYQGRPTPGEGDFFKIGDIVEYAPIDLPSKEELRIYISLDLAVTTKQTNDKTAILVAGVDKHDRIWLIDLYWRRCDTLTATNEIVRRVKQFNPIEIFAEQDHIAKSVGPFLRKRLQEEKLFAAYIHEIPSYTDKKKKAQAIKGRMGMHMVLFPRQAPWFADARNELLVFDKGNHDDFVDALATLGRALNDMLRGKGPPALVPDAPKSGTYGWLMKETRAQRQRSRVIANLGGF